MVGALRDGKVPAEPHTFSPVCNFRVWDVSIKPGATALAQIPLLANSLATLFVRPISPALEAE